jgi:hypothetical protein
MNKELLYRRMMVWGLGFCLGSLAAIAVHYLKG